MTELAMFPLGVNLLPGMILPLNLFEPRYLQMYEDLAAGDGRFGVVLIERGRDTNDGNPVFDVGCVGQILGSVTRDDGSIALAALGGQLLRVDQWLDSDPYPRADVTLWDAEPPGPKGREQIEFAKQGLARLIEVATMLAPEMEVDPPKLADDPMDAGFQIAQIANFGALDNQRILEASDGDERCTIIRSLLDDQVELLELQLGAR